MEVDLSTQLDLFDIVKSAINTDSILKAKFKNRIFEFEPKLKDVQDKGLPYIFIEIPTTSISDKTLKRETKSQLYSSEINVVMDYDIAKTGKLRDYLNRLLKAIENNVSLFSQSGYSEVDIKIETITPEYLPTQASVVRAVLTLDCKGTIDTR